MRLTLKMAMALLLAAAAFSQGFAAKGEIVLKDPTGDDFGPGNYVYPTDAVYRGGSFDLTEVEIKYTDKKVDFSVSVAEKLDDPWGMGVGFAVQMIFIFIDTGDGGYTEGLPGLNIDFDEANAWDKVVVLSPQKAARVKSEAEDKAAKFIKDMVVPTRTTGRSKTIKGSVKLEDLGGGDPSTWSYQVIIQSNEGFPADQDFLTRKVNEYEGQHRFGGGTDYDCDPHVIDMLAGSAEGADSEIEAQKAMLSYECDDEGNPSSRGKIKMVRK